MESEEDNLEPARAKLVGVRGCEVSALERPFLLLQQNRLADAVRDGDSANKEKEAYRLAEQGGRNAWMNLMLAKGQRRMDVQSLDRCETLNME